MLVAPCSTLHRRFPGTALALASLLLPAVLLGQGTLTPPGAPAPTMKSLEQLAAQLTAAESKQEARIAIDTLPGDASFLHIISAPGTYYLRGNITVASGSQAAIRVTVSNVTIDLNGCSVIGPGSATSTAAGITSSSARTRVRNGIVVGFGNGVSLTGSSGIAEDLTVNDTAGFGISTSGATGAVRRCQVQNIASVGITGALVEDCIVSSLSGAAGTKVGIEGLVVRGSAVTSVSTSGASGAFGIRALLVESCRVQTVSSAGECHGIQSPSIGNGVVRGCMVESVTGGTTSTGISSESIATCSVRSVTSSGEMTIGIQGSSVVDCTVSSITNTHASASSCTGVVSNVVRGCEIVIVNSTADAYGIRATQITDNTIASIGTTGTGTGTGIYSNTNAVIRDNSVNNCRNYGIRLTGQSIVYHNTISLVGTGSGITDGALIFSSSNDNRIEANSLNGSASSDYGVRVTGSRNLIIGNRASGTFTGAATGAAGLDLPEFNIAAGCRFGPIAVAAASGEVTTTNPYANYTD